MTSSRCFVALSVLCAAFQTSLPAPASGQDGTPFHIEMWNDATRVEREGYGAENPEFRRRSLLACLYYARQSYSDEPSRLAAWRIASCTGGTQDYVGAFLAFSAFEGLEPDGLLSWSHPRIDQADMARVHAFFGEVPRNVGGTRLVVIPESASITWTGQAPVEIAEGALPEFDHPFVSYGGALYAPVGASHGVRVELEGFESSEVELTFEPLSGGIHEVRVELRESVAPVVEPAPVARTPAPPPMTASERSPPRATFVEEDAGGASGLTVLGWTGVAVGVLGAGGGALLWGLADSIRQDLDTACPTRTDCSAALRSDYEQGRDFTLGGNILMIAGGALATLGVTLLVIDLAMASGPAVTVRASSTSVELRLGGVL